MCATALQSDSCGPRQTVREEGGDREREAWHRYKLIPTFLSFLPFKYVAGQTETSAGWSAPIKKWSQFCCFLIGQGVWSRRGGNAGQFHWGMRRELVERQETTVVETWTGQEVSAPSRGWTMGVRCQRSPGALGSCWTEERTIISPQHSASWAGTFYFMDSEWAFMCRQKEVSAV